MRTPIDLAQAISEFSYRISVLRRQPWYSKARNLAAALIIAMVVFFFAVTLTRSWAQVSPYLRATDMDDVLAGQLFTILAFLLGGVAWHFTQTGFGFGASWQKSMDVHIVSNATKYVPGFGWQYLSKGYLVRDSGRSAGQISMAIATEVILLVGAGVVIASVTAVLLFARWGYPWGISKWAWFAAGAVTLAVTWLWYVVAERRMSGQNSELHLPWLAAAWAVAAIGWLLYATSCWFFMSALHVDVPPISLTYCLVALVIAGVVSILVLIIPGGLGVREAALAYLLLGLMPLSLGIIVSVMMRVSVMLSELVGLGIVALLRRRRPARFSPTYPERGIHRNTSK
jgi:uncharacterized membrane protein YbhN (UPF0104 family)